MVVFLVSCGCWCSVALTDGTEGLHPYLLCLRCVTVVFRYHDLLFTRCKKQNLVIIEKRKPLFQLINLRFHLDRLWGDNLACNIIFEPYQSIIGYRCYPVLIISIPDLCPLSYFGQ